MLACFHGPGPPSLLAPIWAHEITDAVWVSWPLWVKKALNSLTKLATRWIHFQSVFHWMSTATQECQVLKVFKKDWEKSGKTYSLVLTSFGVSLLSHSELVCCFKKCIFISSYPVLFLQGVVSVATLNHGSEYVKFSTNSCLMACTMCKNSF